MKLCFNQYCIILYNEKPRYRKHKERTSDPSSRVEVDSRDRSSSVVSPLLRSDSKGDIVYTLQAEPNIIVELVRVRL